MEFGQRLKALREKAGITRDQLGKRAGVHHASIWRYEAGQTVPRPDAQARLLAVLGEKAGPPVPKRRGRPRGRKSDFVRTILDPAIKKVEAELDAERSSRSKKAGEPCKAAPVRLGSVSRSWVEEMIDNHVHARGAVINDGQVCVVSMRRADLVDLAAAILDGCGTKVEG